MRPVLRASIGCITLLVFRAIDSRADNMTFSLPTDILTDTVVTFLPAVFDISYGQQAFLCAVVSGPSLVQFSGEPGDSLTVTPGISVPGCSGIGILVEAGTGSCLPKSNPLATVVAEVDGQIVASAVATILIPTFDTVELIDSGTHAPPNPPVPGQSGCQFGDAAGENCYFKEYAVLLHGPTGPSRGVLNLTLLTAVETLKIIGNCPWSFPTPTPQLLTQDSVTGLWGVADHLEIPYDTNKQFPPSCLDSVVQTITVGACQVQTNLLTEGINQNQGRFIYRQDPATNPVKN